jgi:hypothetical protein
MLEQRAIIFNKTGSVISVYGVDGVAVINCDDVEIVNVSLGWIIIGHNGKRHKYLTGLAKVARYVVFCEDIPRNCAGLPEQYDMAGYKKIIIKAAITAPRSKKMPMTTADMGKRGNETNSIMIFIIVLIVVHFVVISTILIYLGIKNDLKSNIAGVGEQLALEDVVGEANVISQIII